MAVEWIGVDWGTSHVRAFAMNGQSVLDVARSTDGMASLQPSAFEPALLKLIKPWLPQRSADQTPIDVLACGMVGARQGWVEAEYASVPIGPLEAALTVVETQHKGLRVHIIAGLKQLSPPDVMRGEETQIAGFLARYPGYEGGLCLPGTHSKWARLRDGKVQSFQSYMTGELFDLLSRQSVLRHSMAAGSGADQDADWDSAAFLAGFQKTYTSPQSFNTALFGLRAMDVLFASSKAATRSELSGLLVGLELASACPKIDGLPIAVIGSKAVAAPYLSALTSLGIAADYFDGEEMTLNGLSAVRQTLMRAS